MYSESYFSGNLNYRNFQHKFDTALDRKFGTVRKKNYTCNHRKVRKTIFHTQCLLLLILQIDKIAGEQNISIYN